MPTGLESLSGALMQAQNICWNESIGYTLGGYTDSMGYDCSGLICRCLHDNGFNVTNTRVGTAFLTNHLIQAGFTYIPYSTGMQMQHGDIVNINDGSYGHSYFYANNVYGYTDIDEWYDIRDIKGTCNYAKIEASSSRGFTQSGDQPNSYGAHTEVWVHRLDPNFINNGHPDNTVDILRWSYPDNALAGLAFMIISSCDSYRKRRKGFR